MINFFKGFFGRYWIIKLLILLVLVFWPIFYFKNSVVFDPPKFVEEWIKVGILAVIINFFIFIFVERYNTWQKRQIDNNILHIWFINRIETILHLLYELKNKIEVDKAISDINIQNKLLNEWDILKNSSLQKATLIISNPFLQAKIYDAFKNINTTKFDQILMSLLKLNDVAYFNPDEYQELKNILIESLEEFKKIHMNIEKGR